MGEKETEMNLSFANTYFDHVYVINLEQRPDRKIAMLQKLSRLGIQATFVQAVNGYAPEHLADFERYMAMPVAGEGSHPLEKIIQRKAISSAGAMGYLKTYAELLNDAQQRNFDRILCFDDDALFHKDFENRFKTAVQQIPDDWKLLFLGASQFNWNVPKSISYPDKQKTEFAPEKPYYFPNNTDGSFAIGIQRSVFGLLLQETLLLNCPFDSGPLRVVMQAYPKQCYVLMPNLVIADVTESNIREGLDQKETAQQMRWDLAEYDFPFQKELVSVIMPAFNAEKTIRKAISSILMQDYEALELLVVDDGSTDNTAATVQEIAQQDSRVRLISLAKNSGVGVARNEGIRQARGLLIAFQDADDVSLQHRISRQLIPIFAQNVRFTVSRFYRSRCTMEELDVENQEKMMELVKSRRKKHKSGTYLYHDRPNIGLVNIVHRRENFEQFGLYDNHRFAEDLEWIERMLHHSIHCDFDSSENGHEFLMTNHVIPRLFQRLEDVLMVSSMLEEQNLSIQHNGQSDDEIQRQTQFRQKYKEKGLGAFPKLPQNSNNRTLNTEIIYPTLLPDATPYVFDEMSRPIHRNAGYYPKEAEAMRQSLSWKITAPLRAVLDSLLLISKPFR